MSDPSKTFRNQTVVLSDLVHHGHKVGPDILDDYTFTDCTIIGPAVLMPIGEGNWTNPTVAGPDAFLPIETGREYHGVIGIQNSRFGNCTFERIGIAAEQSWIDQALTQFVNA